MQELAGWLKQNVPASLTLSEAWRLSRDLSAGPLADVWTAGRAAGPMTDDGPADDGPGQLKIAPWRRSQPAGRQQTIDALLTDSGVTSQT